MDNAALRVIGRRETSRIITQEVRSLAMIQSPGVPPTAAAEPGAAVAAGRSGPRQAAAGRMLGLIVGGDLLCALDAQRLLAGSIDAHAARGKRSGWAAARRTAPLSAQRALQPRTVKDQG